jgi:hypothetical protein
VKIQKISVLALPLLLAGCSASKYVQEGEYILNKADVDLLRTKAEDATVEINDIDFSDDGANATVSITVYNFLQMDTIGQEAHLVEETDFHLPMRIENGVWKIRMVNLPRSERRNHD